MLCPCQHFVAYSLSVVVPLLVKSYKFVVNRPFNNKLPIGPFNCPFTLLYIKQIALLAYFQCIFLKPIYHCSWSCITVNICKTTFLINTSLRTSNVNYWKVSDEWGNLIEIAYLQQQFIFLSTSPINKYAIWRYIEGSWWVWKVSEDKVRITLLARNHQRLPSSNISLLNIHTTTQVC